MAGTIKTLYPPLVSTYMPAFLRTSPCRVYFSLSQYNNIVNINPSLVQVSVSYLDTNISALKTSPKIIVDENGNSSIDETDLQYYPLGIYFAELKALDNTTWVDEATHYIDIPPQVLSAIEEGETPSFGLNQTYKVQLRFTSTDASPFPKNRPKEIASWINNNLTHFSEWSRVTLIRGISKPTLLVKGFNDVAKTDVNQSSIISNKILQSFSGELTFDDPREEEYLKYIRIKIYKTIDRESHEPVFDSGEVYSSEYSPNEFFYVVKYVLEEAVQYTIHMDYMTINGYTPPENEDLDFTVTTISRADEDPLNIILTAEMDEENGRMKIKITPKISANLFLGNLIIRRASSEDSFQYWEDLHFLTFDGSESLETEWYDYTVKSGVTYDYGIQKVNEKQLRGVIVKAEKPIMAHFDDMFLTNEKMQLKVKFDPTVSSFKTTIYESKIDTIGSKYPYFKRNANVAYKQFPITGLITTWCDEDGVSLTKDKVYGDMAYLYDKYEKEKRINQYQDFFYEREFREAVMEFLEADDVKLFRSTTEGNILVKLMDISFTPNQTIGRMLYSFSATAYQIADSTIENYDKYGIQRIGEYQYGIKYMESVVGQVVGTYGSVPHLDLVNGSTQGGLKGDIKEKIESLSPQGYIYSLNHLSWVRFTFQSAPYPIKQVADSQTGVLIPVPATKEDLTGLNNNLLLGYIVYINNEPIIVSQKGIYELHDEDTFVTSIRFPLGIEATVKIDYIGKVEEQVDISGLADRLTYYYKVGQMWDMFPVGESIIRDIFLKYYNRYPNEYWRLVSVDEISVETEPGTIIYLRDSFKDEVDKHIVGETGVLTFESSNATIEEMYFGGKMLNPAPTSFGPETSLEELEEIDYNAKENEYIYTGVTVNSEEDIKKPIEHGVYTFINAPEQVDAKILQEKSSSWVDVYKVDEKSILAINQNDNETQAFANTNDYCYFRGHWYPFVMNENSVGEIAYAVSSLINYKYELVKGEWFNT